MGDNDLGNIVKLLMPFSNPKALIREDMFKHIGSDPKGLYELLNEHPKRVQDEKTGKPMDKYVRPHPPIDIDRQTPNNRQYRVRSVEYVSQWGLTLSPVNEPAKFEAIMNYLDNKIK